MQFLKQYLLPRLVQFVVVISFGSKNLLVSCRQRSNFFGRKDFVMVFHNLLADRQTYTGAFIFFTGMKALENHEYAFKLIGVHTDSVVPDGKDPFFSSPFG